MLQTLECQDYLWENNVRHTERIDRSYGVFGVIQYHYTYSLFLPYTKYSEQTIMTDSGSSVKFIHEKTVHKTVEVTHISYDSNEDLLVRNMVCIVAKETWPELFYYRD